MNDKLRGATVGGKNQIFWGGAHCGRNFLGGGPTVGRFMFFLGGPHCGRNLFLGLSTKYRVFIYWGGALPPDKSSSRVLCRVLSKFARSWGTSPYKSILRVEWDPHPNKPICGLNDVRACY